VILSYVQTKVSQTALQKQKHALSWHKHFHALSWHRHFQQPFIVKAIPIISIHYYTMHTNDIQGEMNTIIKQNFDQISNGFLPTPSRDI
jgi:hypothetical protein